MDIFVTTYRYKNWDKHKLIHEIFYNYKQITEDFGPYRTNCLLHV